MSMFCAFPFEDRIELLTDGATYLHGGLLMMTHQKVRTAKTVPMAVTVRGNTVEALALMEACISYADDLGDFGKAVRVIEQEFNQWRGDGHKGHHFQLFMVGFIPGYGIAQFHASTLPNLPYAGVEAMHLNEMYGVTYAGPRVDEAELATFMNEERVKRGAADFGADFCQYVRGRKDHDAHDPDGPHYHAVGGHIDLTTITPEGASTRRLLTWPDELFAYIDPALRPVIAPTTAPETDADAGLMAVAA